MAMEGPREIAKNIKNVAHHGQAGTGTFLSYQKTAWRTVSLFFGSFGLQKDTGQ
jgi:hypothetical protein